MSSLYKVSDLTDEQVAGLLNDSILIVPAVSAGNVPQLAADLLLHSLGLRLVGRLSDLYVYPFAGPRDTSVSAASGGISTAVEVFAGSGLTVVQVRSPPLPGQRRRFVDETLLPFVRSFRFAETLAIASSNAALRESLQGPRYQLLTPPVARNNDTRAATAAGSGSSDDGDVTTAALSARLAKLSLALDTPPKPAPPSLAGLPESGIALDLLTAVAAAGGKICAPLIYVYEGDNFGDAHEFADRVAAAAGVDVTAIKTALPTPGRWTQPVSWQWVYGKSVPVGLEEGLYS
ncbi:hypothetical protein D0Z00_001184 [Geotrichum galactomycetum]|uniref:Uncharacterized protein n=1 Tax=Geotrichum galactomycetum TaxID=27317 RepID=A0ACB6V7R8_9ASCO|nr:hypothetical protein D0Z00_001184 [Geotrichum candidum]